MSNEKAIESLEKLLAVAKLENKRLQDYYGARMHRKGEIRAYETAIKILKEEEV